MSEPVSRKTVAMTVTGHRHSAAAEARTGLGEFLREALGYTGTHLACEHGVCGACTVLVDGVAMRSCLMLAVQADGAEITTVEGLAAADGTLHPVQQALHENFGLQCGFCTPGIAITLAAVTRDNPQATSAEMELAMSGHICRCTGYQGIRRAIRALAGEVPNPHAGEHA